LARVKEGWWEREEVERVTLDWVKTNCKITDRELELLKIINERKLVRRDMLEIISPSYRELGKNRTRIINRSIKKLFKNMCIDKTHEKQSLGEGNTPAILSVDKAGSIILGVKHKPRIKKVKKTVNDWHYFIRQLPINYRHINGINRLEVETILTLNEIGGEIIEWVHERPYELHYGQERLTVIPDVVAKLKFNTEHPKEFYAYIEFDTGSENVGYKEPPIIRDKIIKYKKYKLSKLWEGEYPHFPIILL